jgi:hypothetical protein
MVSMTHTEAKETFNHVLDTVLDQGDSSSSKKSLIEDVITDIFDLITITDDVIDSLAYEDPYDKIFYPIKKGDKMLLRFFLAYQQSLEPATGNFDYKTIIQSNFDSYCISPAYKAALYQSGPALSSSAPSSHLLRQRRHPILPAILQWLWSVAPSRKILHYFQFRRTISTMMSGTVLSTLRQ